MGIGFAKTLYSFLFLIQVFINFIANNLHKVFTNWKYYVKILYMSIFKYYSKYYTHSILRRAL